jgi:hypothetical protein
MTKRTLRRLQFIDRVASTLAPSDLRGGPAPIVVSKTASAKLDTSVPRSSPPLLHRWITVRHPPLASYYDLACRGTRVDLVAVVDVVEAVPCGGCP